MKRVGLLVGELTAILLVGVASAFAGVASQTPRAIARPFAAWRFREDFHHGIPAWMGYPLVQDIGYDPSIYTKEIEGSACLVRDVKSYGQRVLHVGLLKTLRFHAAPSSSFKLSYELAAGGAIKGTRLLLAASDGKLYSSSLPDAPGAHTVDLRGESLRLPKGGADVQAVVIESNVQAPDLGSSNRLIIRQFEVDAERPETFDLSVPKLVRPADDGSWLATQVFARNEPLVVKAETSGPLGIRVYDAAGNRVPIESQPINNTNKSGAIRVTFRGSAAPGLWRAVVKSGRSQTVFEFLVMGQVPAHPRVLLTPERLKQLRNLSHSNVMLDGLRAKAEQLRTSLAYNPDAGNNIALLSDVSVFPGLPEYFTLLEDYGNVIAFNAVEYALSGDWQALLAARRALMTISRWRTWTPPWFTAHGLHTYYEVGVFSQRVAVGYDLIASQLTPAEKSDIAGAAFRNSIAPTAEEYFTRERMPTAASNWMANSVGGAIALDVALYGDAPAWNGRLGAALAELSVAYDHLLKGLFPGDGSEAEPAGYDAFAMEGMSFGLAALHGLKMKPRGVEELMQSFWWPRYAEVTPEMVLGTGDFNGQLRALPGFAWEAEHAHDPSLRAFYDTAKNGSLLGISKLDHTGRTLEMAPGILDLACCSKPAVPAPVPPPSRIFPKRGSAVLRSGWAPTDTVISIRVGPWFNHEHRDEGTFQVAAFGEKLISEAGYAGYYTDPNYKTYFSQAAGHNTVLVDNDPFSQFGEGGRYWKALAHYPSFTAHVLSPQVDYLSAELSPAYDGVLKTFHREFIFLKPDILIIHDRIESGSPHRYTWLLHAPIGARLKTDRNDASIRNEQASAALTALGADSHWSVQAAPLAGHRYGNLDVIKLQQPQEFKLQSPLGTSASFLVGMRFARNGSAAAPLEAISLGSSEGLKAQNERNPWTTVFRTGAGPLTVESISSDGQILGVEREGAKTAMFAAGVHSVTRSGAAFFFASRPVVAVLDESRESIALHVFCAHATDLKVRVHRPAAEVELDGKRIHPPVLRGYADFRNLAMGEHIVRILD